MKKERLQNLLMVLITVASLSICGVILYRHRHPSAPAMQETSLSDSGTEHSAGSGAPSATPAPPDKDTPAGQIYYAFQNLLEQHGFHTSTDAMVYLKGKLIRGTRHVQSDIHITDAMDETALQMEMETAVTSGKKTENSHAAYYQGWYCMDSGKGKETYRTEKSPQSVLSMAAFISDILADASHDLEDMKVEQEGTDTVYLFTLPQEHATKYFCQLIERAAMDTKQLKHVTGEVTDIQMTCQVSKEHILTKQQASITGKVSKGFFSVPATLDVCTDFTTLNDDFTISPPDLEAYPIQ